MERYAVTLNFFVPEEIVTSLREIYIPRKMAFDLRVTGLCHCTVKSIWSDDEFPKENQILDWVAKTQLVLDYQEIFKVKIRGVSEFPNFPYAKIDSNELLAIHRKLFNILPSFQTQFEGDEYIPHVSLGIIEENSIGIDDPQKAFGDFELKEIQLSLWNIFDPSRPQIIHRFTLI